MNVKRIALGALAAALPFTALAAAPAQATGGQHDYAEEPYVKVRAYDHEGKARVKYSCDTEGKHDEYGKLRISFKGESVTRKVKCDGEERKVWVHFNKYKDGYVKATVKDPDGDKAHDADYHDGKKKKKH